MRGIALKISDWCKFWCMYPILAIFLASGILKSASGGILLQAMTSLMPETSVNDDEVVFRYYNKDLPSGETFTIQNVNEGKLKGWRKHSQLKIITHGWLNSDESKSVDAIKNAYLEMNDFNLITVDWSVPASSYIYPLTASKTKNVGDVVAQLINELVKKFLVTLDEVHFIGHSLGAHVMGVAGAAIEGGKIARLTALDPAGPGFNALPRPHPHVLDSTDAKFVDVIHTAGGLFGYGFDTSLGNVDFYPNGGKHEQPGCSDLSCSHARAFEYFAASILHPNAFKAWQCDSWESFTNGECNNNPVEYMGEGISKNAKGNYYLTTKSTPPYGNDD